MWRAALVGVCGAVWGLALARFSAEAILAWLPYTSPLIVAAFTVAGAAAAVVLWHQRLVAAPATVRNGWTLFLPLMLPLTYAAGMTPRPIVGGVLLAGSGALAFLLHWRARPGWVLPAALGLLTLSLYLRTLLPSVGEADTFEFQVVVHKLGVAHPTGYPLYVLLAKPFTFLPLGNAAWRVNLASAVFGTAAVVVLYGITSRLIMAWPVKGLSKAHAPEPDGFLSSSCPAEVATLTAFLAALALATSPTFWSQAIVAEVYTLHNLLVAIILWLLLEETGSSRRRGRQVDRRWHLLFLVLGLSLTNHLTTALLLPAVALALVWDRASWRPRDWLLASGCFLIGLSLYLFIPLRWPALNDGEWMSVRDFLRYITGGQFHGALRLDGWQDLTRWGIVMRLMHQPFGWPGLVLAGVGVVHLARSNWRALVLTGLTFLAFVAYGLNYYVPDIAVFLLPGHMILAIWIGVGVASLIGLFDARTSSCAQVLSITLLAVAALLPLTAIGSNLLVVDRSSDSGGCAWGRYALSQPLEPGSAILADTKKFAPLYYLQQVEGVRRDLDMVLLGTEELYQTELRRRLVEGQTVYLARYLPGLDGLHLRSVGPLAKVESEPPGSIEPPSPDSTLARFEERIELLDAEVERDPVGRALYHVVLTWRPVQDVDGDFVIRFRLVDSEGRGRWTSDGARPVNKLYPTSAWKPGIPVSDYHEVPVPAWLPPGCYSLEVGLFRPWDDTGIPVVGGSGPWFSLQELCVAQNMEAGSTLPWCLFGFDRGLWLTGADIPDERPAGGRVTVDLAWRNVTEDETVELLWMDSEKRLVETTNSMLRSSMVRSRHVISTPQEPGLYALYVGLKGRAARCRWLGSPESRCDLGTVRVVAHEEGLASFDGQIVLAEAVVDQREAEPGDVVSVGLLWRAVRPIADDYTVFVHLVGPDGRLHGQVDSWPVQGTHPTSEWRPGEEVKDDYEVRLEPDAPAGAYRVEVGLYKLETMDRLQIHGAEGDPTGDSFVAGTLDVRH